MQASCALEFSHGFQGLARTYNYAEPYLPADENCALFTFKGAMCKNDCWCSGW